MAYDMTVKPLGRLGNRIALLLTGIWMAERYQGRVQVGQLVAGHPLIANVPAVFDFNTNQRPLQSMKVEWQKFPGYQRPWPPEGDAGRIMQTYVVPHLTMPSFAAEEFVLNIRSGDIFTNPSFFKQGWSGVAGKYFCPPPLSYYAGIIEREQPKRIVVVSSDHSNPVIPALLKRYPEAEFFHQGVEADFGKVASARTLVMSYSSFTESAFLASRQVERCYSMFIGHMLRDDVQRIEYQDKAFVEKPWDSPAERDDDLLNWKFKGEFIEYPAGRDGETKSSTGMS
ncbi:hypothetical protein FEM03_14815 [Phragmitibacter flavus]|uniref:Uncharacterized protein n=1 Tax=Phragmitibacter flavus TaxID=2576071 RepID=A0A5R8KCG7_9BACT|nr:hypothetical protein [Phragmitibacter flavus]TLD70000.1 hypothetical protein FEM03_14815 [Phragmitibacter flavus]